MYEIVFSKQFLRHFKPLPKSVQIKTESLVQLLEIDFRDSRLHTKKLKGTSPYYAFRVGREYRVMFKFENDGSILLLDVRHRKDIYKKL